jgi:mRNA interferase HigB
LVVISYKAIREFSETHYDAEEALNNWYIVAEKSDWANFNEVREVFGSVDSVGNDLYVFNIRGGNYRLIVRIIFKVRTIYIKFVGTHKEYDKVNLGGL